MKRGFDNKKYIEAQTSEILKRLLPFDKIYLEIGGHLGKDSHAKRVLPGYDPNAKLKILKTLKNVELIYCARAKDLASKKRVSGTGPTYKQKVLKDLKRLKKHSLKIAGVVITRYNKEKGIQNYKHALEKKGYKVIITKEEKDYTKNVSKAIKAFSKNQYIKTTAKIIAVTGPAGGAGKMATTMSQIYLDKKQKINAGYAKFETFPIHNLPLNHPVNLAYEAATADLQDINQVDPFHLKHYGKTRVNYNRDIENFKILKTIYKNNKAFTYQSPTDMGVNEAKRGIINDKICRQAGIKEIKRRMQVYLHEHRLGRESSDTIKRMHEIIKKLP